MDLSFTHSNMNLFNFIHLLLLLLLPLIHNATAIDPLFTSCPSNTNNYTVGDAFSHNLNQVMSILTTTSPAIGFGLLSIGQGSNKAHGLALCRGDVTSSRCKRCIINADAHIRRRCSFKKEAIIYHDECLLRYSDIDFFGEMDDNGRKFCMCDARNATTSLFQVMEMMDVLKVKAHLSPLLFATEVMDINGAAPGKMYGLAQCRRDISGGDCKTCLESAIEDLKDSCGGKRGGRVVGESCNVRFESYPFFNDEEDKLWLS